MGSDHLCNDVRVPALLPLMGMYLYLYVRSWKKRNKKLIKTRGVERHVFSCIIPCVGRGSLATLSLRGLLKRIRCHVACCQGVVTVIEAPDGSQDGQNDMEE